jgi:hypothetical protein
MSLSVLVLAVAAMVAMPAKQSDPAAAPVVTAAPAPLPESAATPPVEAVTPSDAPTPEELHEEMVLRERRRVQRTHRILGISTWGSVVTTQALTTVLALNQRTLFGPGACSASPTASTDFGCGPALVGIRNFSGLISDVFYTATAMYAINMLRLDRMGGSSGRSRVALDMHKGTVYLHLAAMVLLPILSFLAETPEAIGFPTGARATEPVQSYQAAMRTVHLVVGYVAVGALTTAMILEF